MATEGIGRKGRNDDGIERLVMLLYGETGTLNLCLWRWMRMAGPGTVAGKGD